MKTVKLPAASLLGRLPLPGKKKEELSPAGPSEPAAPQDGPEKRRRRRKKKAWIKIVIVATVMMIMLSVSLLCSHTKTATAIGTENHSSEYVFKIMVRCFMTGVDKLLNGQPVPRSIIAWCVFSTTIRSL